MYREKRGPLNPTLRMEAGFALVCSTVMKAMGAKKQGGGDFEQADFMTWAVDKKEQDLDAMILQWAGAATDGI